MLQFPAGRILDPGDIIVVANQGAAFQTIFGFPPDYEMNVLDPNITDMLPYPDWSTGKVELVNAGDEILLLDGNDALVDALSWGEFSLGIGLRPAASTWRGRRLPWNAHQPIAI